MTNTNLSALIDQYGDLQAEIAKLEKAERDLKASLAELKPGAYESEKYRLSISDTVRESNDAELKAGVDAAVEAYRATLSKQYLCAHTIKKPVRTHRIGLPTGKDLAQ